MARASTFKQPDATRALKAALAAGLKPSGYTISPGGSIHVDLSEVPSGLTNPLDRLLPR